MSTPQRDALQLVYPTVAITLDTLSDAELSGLNIALLLEYNLQTQPYAPKLAPLLSNGALNAVTRQAIEIYLDRKFNV